MAKRKEMPLAFKILFVLFALLIVGFVIFQVINIDREERIPYILGFVFFLVLFWIMRTWVLKQWGYSQMARIKR
jgi:uncharacterized membrane protein YqjE